MSAARAGQALRCDCGAALEVPTLRGLSQLEPAPPTAAAERAPTWGPRQGGMLLALAVTVVALAAAGWFWDRSRPAQRLTAEETRQMEALTPAQSWVAWRSLEAHGLHVGPDAAGVEQARFASHWVGVALGVAGAAGACFLLSLAWPLVFGKRPPG